MHGLWSPVTLLLVQQFVKHKNWTRTFCDYFPYDKKYNNVYEIVFMFYGFVCLENEIQYVLYSPYWI